MNQQFHFLNDEQRRQLNDIYISIVKKYRSSTTATVKLDATARLTMDEAEKLAELELGERRMKIMQDYTERVENIERNATARRIMNSSVVCQMLDKAFERRVDAIARLDNQKERLAKRIHAEHQRTAIAVEREKSIQRSRSLRDFANIQRLRQTVPLNTQALIDEELFASYLAWCLQFSPPVALGYASANRIFRDNMGLNQWARLLTDLTERNGGST